MTKHTRYPSFDVMREKEHWDEHTQSVVSNRLKSKMSYQFLGKMEVLQLECICSLLVAEQRREIIDFLVSHIDQSLSSSIGESERKVGIPPAPPLVREGLLLIDRYAQERFKDSYIHIDRPNQQFILEELSIEKAPKNIWGSFPQKALFQKLLNLNLESYYSHPTIWSEIGYAGPAYPRGYVRTHLGDLDPLGGEDGTMKDRKYAQEEVDVVIVGAGAAGGVLAKELSEAGMSVVVLDAGPFRDTQKDLASDELAMKNLGWQDTRITDGLNPLQMGHNNSGRGVGGGTVHFTGVFLRFQDVDFKARTYDGVAEDWPIGYEDLAPYYDRIEKEIAVSGPKYFPWGNYQGPYPYPEREPLSPNAYIFQNGCDKLGIQTAVTPLAILSAPFEGRPPCINRGFCNQGCMPNAKFSTLIVHIPKAIKAGAEVLADCMVTQIKMGEDGLAKGVTFVHHGVTYQQKAKLVIVSAYVVETPRLLLNSTNAQFPDGLANSSGLVGKGFMTHSSHDVYARFEEEVRLYKGTPVLATTQDFYMSNPKNNFVRGYTLHAHGARPVEFVKGISKAQNLKGPLWGEKLRETVLDYNFYGRVTLVGEVLPQDHNRVELAEEKDEYGLPRAKVTFSYGKNDLNLIDHAIGKMSDILEAAGGKVEFIVPDTAHLMGGCRMGNNPSTSVVNSYGQTHDIPNLYICDASIFVTSGAGNPTNTVMALALRTAEYIKEKAKHNEFK